MRDIWSTPLEEATEYEAGYALLRDYMRLRVRDPYAFIESRWAVLEEVDGRMQNSFASIPGITYTPESPLTMSAQLLLAMGDFVESVNPDSPYSVGSQLESRAVAWTRRLEQLLDEDDVDEDDL